MKAILIDPFVMTEGPTGGLALADEPCVREIEIDYEEHRIDAIYAALSHSEHPVTCVDIVRLNDSDAIFVDDEGLMYPREHWFLWKGYPQPLAGRGLILGCDDEGETIPPVIDLDAVKAQVLTGFRNVQLSPEGELSLLPQHFARRYMSGWREGDAA